jgi:hypothetical protein
VLTHQFVNAARVHETANVRRKGQTQVGEARLWLSP